MSDEDIAKIAAALVPIAAEADGDGVWPENVAVVDAFLAASSQWRLVAVGGGLGPSRLYAVGLDYAGARAGIEAAGISITPELWTGVRIMEAAACNALNGIEGR